MEMGIKYLIVNVGSTSKRYAVYSEKKEVLNIHFRTNKNLPEIWQILKSKKIDSEEIKFIGVRVVSPGIYFQKTKIVDAVYIKKLEDSFEMAPLHIGPTLEEIKKLQKEFPKAKIIGVSDSAFHATMPEKARLYAIPKNDSDYFEIYRYGYHGISMQSVLNQIKYKKIPSKIIVCHLGGGSSITAIKNGKSAETSMGFTPLEGLPMATRSGNIDIGAALYVAKSKKISIEKLEEYLNIKSGFLGLSGISEDMKKLRSLARHGNKKAKLTVEKYVYEIQKYIGAYAAILGGIDLLIFTGAIGENSSMIRGLVVKDLKHLGIIGSKIKVIHTNEMEEIYKEIIGFAK